MKVLHESFTNTELSSIAKLISAVNVARNVSLNMSTNFSKSTLTQNTIMVYKKDLNQHEFVYRKKKKEILRRKRIHGDTVWCTKRAVKLSTTSESGDRTRFSIGNNLRIRCVSKRQGREGGPDCQEQSFEITKVDFRFFSNSTMRALKLFLLRTTGASSSRL